MIEMKLKFSWIPETDDAKGVKNELSNMPKMPPSGADRLMMELKFFDSVLSFSSVFCLLVWAL